MIDRTAEAAAKIQELADLTDDQIAARATVAELELRQRGARIAVDPVSLGVRLEAIIRILIRAGITSQAELDREIAIGHALAYELALEADRAAEARRDLVAIDGGKPRIVRPS